MGPPLVLEPPPLPISRWHTPYVPPVGSSPPPCRTPAACSSSTQKSVVQFSDAQAPVVQQIANSRVCCTTFSIKFVQQMGFVGQFSRFVGQFSPICWTVAICCTVVDSLLDSFQICWTICWTVFGCCTTGLLFVVQHLTICWTVFGICPTVFVVCWTVLGCCTTIFVVHHFLSTVFC